MTGDRGQGAGDGYVRAGLNSFRELRVWQASMDLVEAVYRTSATFPNDERYGLTGQIRRAVVSIPSNIAEGQRRESTKEYLNYISMAQGSLGEVETQLEVAVRLKYISQEQLQPLIESVCAIGRQLYALRNALVRRP